jgi:Tat protein secretion system quality control protein TatD with DNase activity
VAEAKGVPVEAIAEATRANAHRVFSKLGTGRPGA